MEVVLLVEVQILPGESSNILTVFFFFPLVPPATAAAAAFDVAHLSQSVRLNDDAR